MYYLNRLDLDFKLIDSNLVHVFLPQLKSQLLIAEYSNIGGNVWENRLTGQIVTIVKAVPSRSGY